MNKNLKPILILFVIAPFLAELLSGNIPFPKFFHPLVFLSSLIIYGFPALLVREASVRWKLGLAGIFILGLAYGFVNEGIAAKTMLLEENVPIKNFDHYGILLGINFPWAVIISIWHATHAILYPLLIVYFFFPASRNESWLGKKGIIFTALATIILSGLMFFNKTHIEHPIYLIVFYLVIFALIFLARTAPKHPALEVKGKFSLKPVFLGFTFSMVFYITAFMIPKLRLSPLIFYSFIILYLYFVFLILRKKEMFSLPAILLFGIGNYLYSAIFSGIPMMAKGYLPAVITEVIFAVVFAGLIKIISKINKNETAL